MFVVPVDGGQPGRNVVVLADLDAGQDRGDDLVREGEKRRYGPGGRAGQIVAAGARPSRSRYALDPPLWAASRSVALHYLRAQIRPIWRAKIVGGTPWTTRPAERECLLSPLHRRPARAVGEAR